MVFGEKLEKDFYKALHLIFRSRRTNYFLIFNLKFSYFLAFVDDLNEYSFSFGMYLPPMVRTSSFIEYLS